LPENIIEFGRQLLGADDFQKVLETLRGVSEADQARDLVRATLIAVSLHIQRIYLYTLDDSADSTGGKNQEAAEWIEKSMQANPSDFIKQSGYYELARVYQKLNRKADSQRALDELKKLKARQAEAATDRAK